MKNYIQVFIVGLTDGMGNLLAYTFEGSYAEAIAFKNSNGWDAGPQMYYFLNSKFWFLNYISQLGWSVNADCTLPPQPGRFTQDTKEAQAWGGDQTTWQIDTGDEKCVKALVIAEKTRRTVRKVDYSGAPGLLEALAALPELAAQLTKNGQLRQAGIVTYAYEQVIKQYWSITEAFAYLRDQRIV